MYGNVTSAQRGDISTETDGWRVWGVRRQVGSGRVPSLLSRLVGWGWLLLIALKVRPWIKCLEVEKCGNGFLLLNNSSTSSKASPNSSPVALSRCLSCCCCRISQEAFYVFFHENIVSSKRCYVRSSIGSYWGVMSLAGVEWLNGNGNGSVLGRFFCLCHVG